MVLKLQSKSMLQDINDRLETKTKTTNTTNKLLEDKISFVFTFLHLTAAVMFSTVIFRDIIFDCHALSHLFRNQTIECILTQF